MTEIDALVVQPILPDQMAALDRTYRLHRYDSAPDKAELLRGVGDRIRAVVTTGGRGFTAELLARLPALEIVASSGVGTDTIAVDACKARGVAVTNTPDVLNDDVADLGIGLVIAAMREMPKGHDYVRSGDWGRQGMMGFTTTLTGKTLGIVGLGRIGTEVANRATALKMRVAYTGRRRQPVDFDYYPSVEDLARAADVLVLTCPGGPATRGLIGAAELSALGPKSWLVNLARGSVVDEPALIAALESGGIRGAALDVYASEPNPDPRLTRLPNVVLYPHHSSGSIETRTRMSQMVVDNLAAWFGGRPLLSPLFAIETPAFDIRELQR
ncbi:2-hydroxyacid dehydrogenase [Methylobrevis albus]|uniref:2-hydroxyacid dehydrogenase n=1 Tax=Methylobrevis albus TaxID=2793297 RepID=A0A931MZI1_9HYPH|nr:2-hydroxyacid dehydrogenase [Methylobrevis albus]MBH0239482.1 2-hydroxyacid dehydrogenase [Methylobrevis albus]